MRPPRTIALTWTAHRRTENLALRLGWEYVVIASARKGLRRYLQLLPRTARFLSGARPQILVAQNPSLVLAALCLLLRPFLRYRLVVDAHNEAVQPFLNTSAPLKALARWCLRRADLTIVTNENLAQVVSSAGGRPFVLPDPLPVAPEVRTPDRPQGRFRAIVVSTFAPDEPLPEILEAARRLGGEFELLVTGRREKLPKSLAEAMPGNVTLTGFLPDPDYWGLLAGADVVVDLTHMPDCLVCGAYEAVAVHRPLILTRSSAAESWFGTAAAYVSNEPAEIAEALRAMRDRHSEWLVRSQAAAQQIDHKWTGLAASLAAQLRPAGG